MRCLITLLLIFLFSLSHAQKIQTTNIKQNAVIPYSENDPNSGTLTISFNIAWPIGGTTHEALTRIQDTLSKHFFGDEGMHDNIYTSINLYIKRTEDYFRSTYYREDNSLIGWNQEEIYNGRFLTTIHGITSYIEEGYRYYPGCPHGYDHTKCFNFENKTGRQITETDLFVANYKDELARILAYNFKKSSPDVIDFLLAPITPNNNFYITKTGFTYVYNPLEIAVFGEGTIKISVTWKDIAFLLKTHL